MAFEIDILIVYSENDNQENTETGNGWVTDFQRFLELMLVQVLGKKPNIQKKSENDTLTGANLDQVGMLIPVLSESFMASGACLDVIEEFYKKITDKDPQRIFKVLKTPILIENQPPKLKERIGYDLYFINPETGETEDFKDFFSTYAERDYWMKIVDLAYDIHESIMFFEEKTSGVQAIYSRRTIYLAETGHDLSVQRNIIKRDLQRHGYKVLPDQTLPQELDRLEKQVKDYIASSDLSIHLIGNSYGEIPEGSDRSVVDIQNKIAALRSMEVKDKSTFSRLIWISPHLENASEKQLAFIENIKRDLSSSEGAEILQTPLEDFKNIVREELIEVGLGKKYTQQATTSNGKPSVYVLHDKIDEQGTEKIKKAIEKAGYKVLTPAFNGELLELRQRHITNLRDFDAAIIYQDKVNDQWVRMKLLDLLKAPGFGRKKPIKGKAIMSNKDNSMMGDYEKKDIMLIKSDSSSAMDSLKAFLDEIKTRE
ncbi:MAG: DUF4062 domain-containing protein [Fulvivirga sp.]|nr:DUF4062 domain-containing protein [Fulvivirga sp.]